jgi:D-lactate dehydrogenase (cytochrome)
MSASSTLPLGLTPAIKHDTSAENLSTALAEFTAILGSDSVSQDQEACAARSGSRWSEASPSHKASLIVYPTSTQHVSDILKVCHKRRIPVTPYSGGTGLSGSLAATRGGVCVDLSSMTKIWNLHESDMDVTVQPGVGWMDLNAELAANGLFFPPDPSPAAKIGGMVGSSFPSAAFKHTDRNRFIDSHGMFRNECLPTRYYERLGDLADRCACGWHNRHNP